MRAADRSGAARARGGFATATVLGLLAVAGMLGAAALHDALFGEQLAGSRMLQQRALAHSSFGVDDALARVATMTAPAARSYALRPLPSLPDSVEVELRHLGAEAAAGFSAEHFLLHRFEIESTAHTGRGIQARQFQGVTRLLPVTATQAADTQP